MAVGRRMDEWMGGGWMRGRLTGGWVDGWVRRCLQGAVCRQRWSVPGCLKCLQGHDPGLVSKNDFHLNSLGTQHDSGRFDVMSAPCRCHKVVSLHYPLRPGSPSARLHAKQSLSRPQGPRIKAKRFVFIPASRAISAIRLLQLTEWAVSAPRSTHSPPIHHPFTTHSPPICPH